LAPTNAEVARAGLREQGHVSVVGAAAVAERVEIDDAERHNAPGPEFESGEAAFGLHLFAEPRRRTCNCLLARDSGAAGLHRAQRLSQRGELSAHLLKLAFELPHPVQQILVRRRGGCLGARARHGQQEHNQQRKKCKSLLALHCSLPSNEL